MAKKRPATKRVRKTPRSSAKRSVAAQKNAARAAASRGSTRRRVTPKPSAVSAATTMVRGLAAGAVAVVANRLARRKDENDPIALLEADHRRFENLLSEGEQTTERGVKRRTELLRTLTTELNLHELLEEQILYPALEPHEEARSLVLESFQEHHVADLVVRELRTLAKNDEKWGAKFKVLKENIEHHIKEEERTLFRTARAVFTRDELLQLGKRMQTLRRGNTRSGR